MGGLTSPPVVPLGSTPGEAAGPGIAQSNFETFAANIALNWTVVGAGSAVLAASWENGFAPALVAAVALNDHIAGSVSATYNTVVGAATDRINCFSAYVMAPATGVQSPQCRLQFQLTAGPTFSIDVDPRTGVLLEQAGNPLNPQVQRLILPLYGTTENVVLYRISFAFNSGGIASGQGTFWPRTDGTAAGTVIFGGPQLEGMVQTPSAFITPTLNGAGARLIGQTPRQTQTPQFAQRIINASPYVVSAYGDQDAWLQCNLLAGNTISLPTTVGGLSPDMPTGSRLLITQSATAIGGITTVNAGAGGAILAPGGITASYATLTFPSTDFPNGTEMVLIKTDVANQWQILETSAGGSGSGGLFLQAGANAIARTFQSKDRDVVSVFDFLTPAQITDVQNATTLAADPTANIQNAINAAISLSKALFFPAGTYSVSLGTNITLEGGVTVCAFVATSQMQLIGEGMFKSIIKLKDNQSTNASPKYFNIIAGNTVMTNILIRDLQFNINGANNKINANNGYNCSAFICSGSVATVGVDARLHNAKFLNLFIQGTPGNNCIGLGQSNSIGYTLGQNVEIAGCIFYNNGLDTNDHSSVYAFAESVDVHDNLFYTDAMSNGVNGPRVACELHAARSKFHNNEVFNYFQGVLISDNQTSAAYHLSVDDNDFVVCNMAAGAHIEAVGTSGCKYITINSNRILITDDNHAANKVAIGVHPSNGNFNNVSVCDNVIFSLDTNVMPGIKVYSLATLPISDIVVDSNNIKGVTNGVALGIAGGQNATNVSITNNAISSTTTIGTPTFAFGVNAGGAIGIANISGNTITGTIDAGIWVDSACVATKLSITNNVVTGTTNYGIAMPTNANITNINIQGNDASTASIAQILDQLTVAGHRTGRQACTFAALPTQSAWYAGDIAYNSGVTNAAGQVTAWFRLTSGSGNVLNTDWRAFGVTI